MASRPGCCCSSPTDPCHRQPSDLSSASHLKLKSFQSLCRTFLSVGERFLCFLQTDGRFIVLLTVKSHFSHFYRGWCRDFVISKKLSASVKWDLGADQGNALNHENKTTSHLTPGEDVAGEFFFGNTKSPKQQP